MTDQERQRKENSEGALDEAKGRVKEAYGALTDDEDMKREGQLDKAAGEAKNRLSEAIDRVREGVGSLLKDDEKSEQK